MGTFQSGDFRTTFAPGERLETLVALAHEASRLGAMHGRRAHLLACKHGHEFVPWTSSCLCGTLERDYYFQPVGERQLCPLATKEQPET